jgi:hypothetical protein
MKAKGIPKYKAIYLKLTALTINTTAHSILEVIMKYTPHKTIPCIALLGWKWP